VKFKAKMDQAKKKQQEAEQQQARMQIEGGSLHEPRHEKD